MPYPSRPTKDPLPQFAGTASSRPTPQQRAELIAFVTAGYLDGLSLRELAELTDRTQTAVRRALDQAGVRRREAGAPVATENPETHSYPYPT
ncbi:helix-turn-helix domain-containing protein [Nocardioides sp. URHA0020]|uniref:helix-turn-helix domain-containing protein n=1 Tax=Nocardioides sp. URHA0020 TaxID=1380392 RepID=UPI0009DEA768